MNFNKRLRLAQEKFAEGKTADENAEYQLAANAFLMAADLLKGIKGEEKNYASCLGGAANAFADLRSFDKAKKTLEQALSIQRKFLGSEHLDVATSLGNLATIYAEEGNYDTAIELHKNALNIMRGKLSPEDTKIARCLSNMAHIYLQKEDSVQAQSLFKDSLSILKDPFKIAEIELALTVTYMMQGDHETAISLYEKNLPIIKKNLDNNSNLGNFFVGIGSLYEKYGESQRAKELIMLGNDILGNKLDINNPNVDIGIHHLANTFSRNNQLSEYVTTSISHVHETIFQFLVDMRPIDGKIGVTPKHIFTLRTSKNDEQGRLSKGYWFSGDDESLYFSCWKGIDTTVQMPTIAIVIDSQQQVTLQFNGKDSAKKEAFLADLTKLLDGFSQFSDTHARWRKTYSQETWKEALVEFFTIDKPQIDEYLAFNNNAVEDFTPIPEKEFAQSLKFTVFLREKLKEAASTEIRELNEVGKPLKLQSLQLENIGHFESVGFDLSRQITILIGENGSGKSTILKAIALGLSGKAKTLQVELIQDYLRILETDEDGTKHFCNKGAIHLNLQINTIQSQLIEFNDIELGGVDVETFVDNTDEWLLASENRFIDLVLGFPQGKKRESKRIGNIVEPNLNDVLDLIEDRDISKWKADLVEWIVALYREPNTEIREKNLSQIKWVFDIISKIISDNEPNAIRLKSAVHDPATGEKDIIICTPDMPDGISLDLLSQGYTNIFIWVGRLIMRLYAALSAHQFEQAREKHLFLRNPNTRGKRYEANTIQELHGIVLIDEIDTYLHPKWQRNILRVLAETFPCLQFVVTSHSMAILSSLKNTENYYIYRAVKEDEHVVFIEIDPTKENPYGADLNTIADRIGFPNREPVIQQELDKIIHCIANNELEKAEQLIADLKTEINPSDEALRSLKNRLATRKLLMSKK